MRFRLILFSFLLAVIACDQNETSGDGLTGIGGSTTRFAIQGDYMYIVTPSTVDVFSISDEQSFAKVASVDTQGELETIFAKGEYLYLGARDGMYIFSISDPAHPNFLFRYEHILSCDPVVVQGNLAYVTLSRGATCPQGVNRLDVIDITDKLNPFVVKSVTMTNPRGLSVDGNFVFICQGEFGLTVLDTTTWTEVYQLGVNSDFDANDVITHNNVATVTGSSGIFQFSYDEFGSLTLLSMIAVTDNDE